MWIFVLQRLTLEFLFDFFYFPLWWYTGGAKQAVKYCFGLLQDANMFLAPGLWLKNIFVPMFGQTDWQGRIMSFFMRLVNILFRSLGLFISLVVVLLLFTIWLALPVFVFYMLYLSLV